MKDILKKSHGILITGQDNTSKMALAKVIAESVGFFAMVGFEGIDGPYNSVFLTGPDVLIVYDFDPTYENLAEAKQFIIDDKIIVERRGYDPQIVDLPCFIFVTSGAQVIKLAEASSQFTVISIGG